MTKQVAIGGSSLGNPSHRSEFLLNNAVVARIGRSAVDRNGASIFVAFPSRYNAIGWYRSGKGRLAGMVEE